LTLKLDLTQISPTEMLAYSERTQTKHEGVG